MTPCADKNNVKSALKQDQFDCIKGDQSSAAETQQVETLSTLTFIERKVIFVLSTILCQCFICRRVGTKLTAQTNVVMQCHCSNSLLFFYRHCRLSTACQWRLVRERGKPTGRWRIVGEKKLVDFFCWTLKKKDVLLFMWILESLSRCVGTGEPTVWADASTKGGEWWQQWAVST